MKRHVWTLSWFDPRTDRLVGEATFEALSDDTVAEILGVPVEQILDGEFVVDSQRARRFTAVTGHSPLLDEYDYFIGATAD